MKILLLILLSICSCAVSVLAQDITFERITPGHGLSQGSVNYILQDQEGYMWFSTRHGLNQYNGYQFTTFESDPTDSESLSSSHTKCLYEDKTGTLWIGTVDGGLNQYNRKTGAFKAYQTEAPPLNGLSDNTVQAICEDLQGNLWVGTRKGLNRLDRQTGIFTTYYASKESPNSLIDNDVRVIKADAKGHLWIGTEGGLSRFDPKREYFTNYTHDSLNVHSLSHNTINALHISRDGTIWIGTYGGGLNRFNPQTERFTRYMHNAGDATTISDNFIMTLCETSSGALWVGTRYSGVNVLYPGETTFVHHQQRANSNQHLADNFVLYIFEDRNQAIWVGTYTGGISKYDPVRTKFSNVRISDISKNSGTNQVHAIYEDTHGNLWIGLSGSINKLNRKTGNFTQYLLTPSVLDSRWWDYNVYAIQEDQAGNLWTASSGIGLSKFNPQNEKFTHYPLPVDAAGKTAVTGVSAIYEDDQRILWLATSSGVGRFDPFTESFQLFAPDSPADGTDQKPFRVSYLTGGLPGELWVGTEWDGLFRFDCRTNTFTHYEPSDFSSIKGKKNLNYIYFDQFGYVWTCYSRSGLYRFDPLKETFTAYSGKNGLPNNVFRAIREDSEGNLWLSTTRGGLYRLNAITRDFRRFDTRDGLHSNEFNGACFKNRRGELFFGGNEGFSYFNPANLINNPHVPPVIISGFQVFNEPVPVSSSRIQLRHNQHSFSFEFVALNYTLSEKNQYKYKLEGLDKDWISAGTRRFASYTNVDPGTYTFRVKAANNDDLWNDEGASMQIIIPAPFWQTVWFQLVCVSILLIIWFVGYKMRINVIERQKRYLAQLVMERTEELRKKSISLEVNNRVIKTQRDSLKKANQQLEESLKETEHLRQQAEEASRFKSELFGIAVHDLKNPLGGIRLYAELIRESAYDEAKVKEMIGIIERTAQSMFDLISNLLKTVKINNSNRLELHKQVTDLTYLAGDVVERNRVIAARKGQTIEFHCEGECTAAVDPKLIREVFDNLLSNAIKYTLRHKTIWASIARKGDKVQFQVVDEGVGIRPEDIPNLFVRFRRFAHPTGNESSTGLGLSIVRQLVELHGGRVWASSEGLSKGSTFIVELPAVAETVSISRA